MSVSVFLYILLRRFLSFFPVSTSLCLFPYLSLSIHLSINPSVNQSILISINLSIYLIRHLLVCQPITIVILSHRLPLIFLLILLLFPSPLLFFYFYHYKLSIQNECIPTRIEHHQLLLSTPVMKYVLTFKTIVRVEFLYGT